MKIFLNRFRAALGNLSDPVYEKTLRHYASTTSVTNLSPPRKVVEAIWLEVDEGLAVCYTKDIQFAEHLYNLNHYFEIGRLGEAMEAFDILLWSLTQDDKLRELVGAKAAGDLARSLETLGEKLLSLMAPLAKSTILREAEALYDYVSSEGESFDELERKHLAAARDLCDCLWLEGVSSVPLNEFIHHVERLNLIRSKQQRPVLELLMKLRAAVEELTVDELWEEHTGE